MEKILEFMMPEHMNRLYTEEAVSSVSISRLAVKKINEIIDELNKFANDDITWKQEQSGRISKAVLYMKDNLVNSLYELLRVYDNETIRNLMLEVYGAELNRLKVFATPQMFGAVADGVANDIEAIEKAIASLSEGGTLYFPPGTYVMKGREVIIDKPHITFAGEGLIICDYGFRPKASHFKAVGLRMESDTYSEDSRAFLVDNKAAAGMPERYIGNFVFKDCHFTNFFYSVCAIGGAYNHDGTESAVGYPVRDLVIENCHSTTYTDKNAAHFQCIQVENISYINNRTFGGQNASSYNAIKGNGFIRVVGNYDHNNSYASCEIENGSGNTVVANNTFKAKIWVDDSYDTVVDANSTEEGILITVGSNVGDAANIIVSNNVCRNIRCEQFGTYNGGTIKTVNIDGNIVNGENTHGIWIHGNAVKTAKVSNNLVSGTNTNDIAIQRNEQLVCYIHSNIGNGKKLLIAGSGGKVFAIDNYNVSVSGNRDALEASHLEKSFNGLKITDTNNVAWRLNVNTSGQVTTTKY